MGKFRIQPHGRLQEWVADAKGYFRDEGLDYEFAEVVNHRSPSVQSAEGAPMDWKEGATTRLRKGENNVTCACHWAVNMASTTNHGRMWGHAYAVTPSGIFVPPESPIRKAEDLANVEVCVGYLSGAHFSTLQALEKVLKPGEIKLKFGGNYLDRLALLLERRLPAANGLTFTVYVLEQQGFRKILDTSFMVGFLIAGDVEQKDLQKYFRALHRAQEDIDLEPELYKHYFLKELPEKFHPLVDVRGFGPGERIVFEPYTREIFEKTHKWTEKVFPEGETGIANYESAVQL